MKMPWETECFDTVAAQEPIDPLAIPDCLKRDKNNVAPFMRKTVNKASFAEAVRMFATMPGLTATPAAILPPSPPDWAPPWGSK